MSGRTERRKIMKEIVGIGACVMDTLITVPNYPEEDTKLSAVSFKPAGGGPVATGLVAAQRLGAETAFIGVLSNDSGGKFLAEDFKKYGVDTSLVHIENGFRSFTSVVMLSAESKSRTCVFDKGNLPELTLDSAQTEALKAADLLMIDGNEMNAAAQAVKIARENGTKVLYDAGGLYEGVESLLPYADILIPSEEFALGYTGCADAMTAAEKLYSKYRPEVVVITRGKKGGIMLDAGGMREYPALPADVVDSNGAGDVFHGAFAAGVIKGYDYYKCCYFASAVSAVKCTGIGARESVPDFETVRKYLKENGYEL